MKEGKRSFHIIKVDEEAYHDILSQGIPHEDIDKEIENCLEFADEHHQASCLISILKK